MIKNRIVPMGLFFSSALMNLIIQVIMTRSLGPENYGEFAKYWSQITNFTLIFYGLQIFTANTIQLSIEDSKEEYNDSKVCLDSYSRSSILWGTVFSTIALAFIMFNLDGQEINFMALAMVILSVPSAIALNIGFGKLQGRDGPHVYQIWGFAFSFAKLVLVIVAGYISNNPFVLLFILLTKQTFSSILLLWSQRRLPNLAASFFDLKSLQLIIHYALFYFIFGFDVAIYSQISSAEMASQYAVAANVVKPIIIVATFIPTLIFRENRESKSTENNFIGYKEKQGAVLVLLASIAISIFIYFFSYRIILLVYGDSFIEASRIIPWMLVSLIPMALYYYYLTFSFFHLTRLVSMKLFVIAIIQLAIMKFAPLGLTLFISLMGLSGLLSLGILLVQRQKLVRS